MLCRFIKIKLDLCQYYFMLRRFYAILLLICLVAPVAVTYNWLQHKKYVVRKTVKRKIINGIDKNQLVLLKFTKPQTKTLLHWKHSKEFEFEGQMYDIVETVFCNDSIFYYCWWDKEETALNQQLMAITYHLLGTDPMHRQQQSKLEVFFKSLYCNDLIKHNFLLCFFKTNYQVFKTQNYICFCQPPPVPPPIMFL